MRRWLVSIIGVLGVLVIGSNAADAAAPGPEWLVVTSHSARTSGESAVLTLRTQGEIPVRANDYIKSNLGVGYAWADVSTGKVLAMTIHPTLGVDSVQNPRGWHAHTVTLTGGAKSPNDFCIKSVDTHPFVRLSIDDNMMRVRVPLSDLPEPVAQLSAVVGFTIEKDASCASTLAVRIATAGGDD